MKMPLPLRLAPAVLPLALLAPLARAQSDLELGKMWTFENPPLEYLKQEYEFAPAAEWLDALRLASLRFGGGCSASFVSPKGLIMTNHHCTRDEIAKVSPKDRDWVQDGFYAASLADEVRIPDLTVQQLVKMEDVTAAMNAGITAQDDDDAIAAKHRDNQRGIEKSARDAHPGLQPQVVKLHQGAAFHLYLYKVWNDIRLVCAPHLQTAHFGGDPDNFTYPRYSIDFAFCRAYENDAPADTSRHYFRWSTTGPVENELVFVTGNPGSTDRLKTRAQMQYLRDASFPIVREMIDNRLAVMRDLAKDSALPPEQRTSIFMLENAQKAYKGYHESLLDAEMMERKARAEAEFERRVQASPELSAQFGDAWTKLEEIAALKTAFEGPRRFHTPGGSPQLARALAVVRAVAATGEARTRQAEVAKKEFVTNPVVRAWFVDHLERAVAWLPPHDRYLSTVLDGRTPEETADLLDQSAVADDAFVANLLEAGAAEVRASEDPAIRIAAELDPLLRARDKLEAWLNDQENAQGARVGRALFACYGNDVSPDATFTLRFSDGRVEGFPCNGTIAPFRTSFWGLYARHAEFDGAHPFDLPPIWLERKDRIDMDKSVNFVSSNDIIGGNSGSPIVNRNLEVVGLIFDGNIEMLANRFMYSDDVPRAVSVHVDAIMQALRVIYGADRIAGELVGE